MWLFWSFWWIYFSIFRLRTESASIYLSHFFQIFIKSYVTLKLSMPIDHKQVEQGLLFDHDMIITSNIVEKIPFAYKALNTISFTKIYCFEFWRFRQAIVSIWLRQNIKCLRIKKGGIGRAVRQNFVQTGTSISFSTVLGERSKGLRRTSWTLKRMKAEQTWAKTVQGAVDGQSSETSCASSIILKYVTISMSLSRYSKTCVFFFWSVSKAFTGTMKC